MNTRFRIWMRSAGGRWCLAVAPMLSGSCVEEKLVGLSTELSLVDAPDSELAPGAKRVLTFQAIDGEGKGAPDQALELVITDLGRLRFEDDPGASRRVLTTNRNEAVGGAVLSGAALVGLAVPEDAPPGAVTIIGSLEGKKGTDSKTQWKTFTIVGSGEGGAGGARPNGGTGQAGDSATGGASAGAGGQ